MHCIKIGFGQAFHYSSINRMLTADELTSTLAAWQHELNINANPEKIAIFKRFFKTGPGEYGEGDEFIGLSVPDNRRVSKRYYNTDIQVIDRMLEQQIHEYRLAALLALVERYHKERQPLGRTSIALYYVDKCHLANNWDLVDLSAPYIVGRQLSDGLMMDTIRRLSRSTLIWERRVAVVSTLMPVRKGMTGPAIEMCDSLVADPHTLIHKAVGWVLREVGKHDADAMRTFISGHIGQMSAVTLSYATERLSADERRQWRELRKSATQ